MTKKSTLNALLLFELFQINIVSAVHFTHRTLLFTFVHRITVHGEMTHKVVEINIIVVRLGIGIEWILWLFRWQNVHCVIIQSF